MMSAYNYKKCPINQYALCENSCIKKCQFYVVVPILYPYIAGIIHARSIENYSPILTYQSHNEYHLCDTCTKTYPSQTSPSYNAVIEMDCMTSNRITPANIYLPPMDRGILYYAGGLRPPLVALIQDVNSSYLLDLDTL